MSNRIKSGIKRVKIAERNRQRNIAAKSAVKSSTKNVLLALEEDNAEKAKEMLPLALSKLDKAASKGIIHKNTASRKKSRLVSKVNQKLKA